MSAEHGLQLWSRQTPVDEIDYAAGFDYAMPMHAPGGWTFDSSPDHLHNAFIPIDRHRVPGSVPSVPRPAYQALVAEDAASQASPAIKVFAFQPSCGSPGCRVDIHIKSPYSLSFLSTFRFSVMFLDKRVDASLTFRAQAGQDYRYLLTAHAPLSNTNGPCPLKVAVADLAGNQLDLLDVGKFKFTGIKKSKAISTPERPTRKRKSAEVPQDTPLPCSKKISLPDQQTMAGTAEFWSSPQYPQSYSYPMSTDWQPQFNYTVDSLSPTLLQSSHHQGYGPVMQEPANMQQYISTPEHSHGLSASPRTHYGAPQTPNNYDLGSPLAASDLPLSLGTSPSPENPPLIRTTQRSTQQVSSSYSDDFEPDGQHTTGDASLRIPGNLNSMQEKWTEGEKISGRRLIEFERSQAGSVVTITFKQVPLNSRTNTNACVSCIWWEERKEGYITSVDTIRLLEHLVASRFNVQEKNRIRRNLEGFHPLTVAKGRANTDSYFKRIMGFGEPKPRVIEKDIKVFRWASLHGMLKKVVGKYSADYATAAESLRPVPPTARSSISGLSSAESDSLMDPAHPPTSITLGPGSGDQRFWDSSFSGLDTGYGSGVAIQPGLQQPCASSPPPFQYDSYYALSGPSLYQPESFSGNAPLLQGSWDSGPYPSSATLSATPGLTMSGYSPEFYLDPLHHHLSDSQQTIPGIQERVLHRI